MPLFGSGSTYGTPSSFKGSRGRHSHDKVPHNSHTSVHLANYTEKSLLVMKNYVFMEKDEREGSHVFRGQGDAFTSMGEDMAAGVSMDLPTAMWENNKGSRRAEKTIAKKKSGGKPRSWMPNGGGIKPYNSPEAQKAIVPPEDCIINVKAVKPKVDTWFRLKPKNNPKGPPQVIQHAAKTTKSTGQPQNTNLITMKRAATTIVKHHSRTEEVGENEGDKTVKNLTSFWNEHLQKSPLTIVQNQKPPAVDTRIKRPGDVTESKSRKQVAGRPKSVGSGGVILEHTLQPSKILSKKKRLSSLEDIIVFAKLRGSGKSGGDGPTAGNQQVLNGKRTAENVVKSTNDSSVNRNVSVPQRYNVAEVDSLRRKPQEKPKIPVKTHHRCGHPKFVVRLHPRWILALRVLALSYRPLKNMWKRKWFSSDNGLLKLADECLSHTEQTSRLMSGAIIKETLATRTKKIIIQTGSERFRKLKRLARQGMSYTLKILTDTTQIRWKNDTSTSEPYAIVRPPLDAIVRPLDAIVRPRTRLTRAPLVTEPSPDAFSAFARTRHLDAATLEVLPRGVRVSLYIEYHLVFSFILVQTVLLAIALFIKWLQEYTM